MYGSDIDTDPVFCQQRVAEDGMAGTRQFAEIGGGGGTVLSPTGTMAALIR